MKANLKNVVFYKTRMVKNSFKIVPKTSVKKIKMTKKIKKYLKIKKIEKFEKIEKIKKYQKD
jgi:hypothetical protein